MLNNDKLYSYELISLYRFKRDKVPLVEEYLNLLPENPSFLTQAENTLSSMFEGPADYDVLEAGPVQTYPERPAAYHLYRPAYLAVPATKKDTDQALNQALALSRRQNDDGNSIYELCQTLIADEAYDTAIRGYEYIISKGKDKALYISAKIELINTKNLLVTSGV